MKPTFFYEGGLIFSGIVSLVGPMYKILMLSGPQ